MHQAPHQAQPKARPLSRDTAEIEPALEGVVDVAVEKSLDHCLAYVRREVPGSWIGARFIPEPRRSAVCALLAWDRRVSAEVDSIALVEMRRQALAMVRDQTERALRGEPPMHADPVWPAFAATVRSYAIPRAWVVDAFDSIAWRVTGGICETDKEARAVSLRVGARLAAMALAVCGVAPGADAGRALALARRRGGAVRALAVLGSLRQDLSAKPKRTSLAMNRYRAAKVGPGDVRAWTRPDRCEAFVLGVCEWIGGELDATEALVDMIAPDCEPAWRAADATSRGYLGAIERDPKRVISPEGVDLPRFFRARLSVGSAVGSAMEFVRRGA